MCPQPIEFKPSLPTAFPEPPRYIRFNHIALSAIVSETLTSLYVSLLKPTIFTDYDSEELVLNKLKPFRTMTHPSRYTYSLWMNKLAFSMSSTITDIYRQKTSFLIQDQSILLFKPTNPETNQSTPQYINFSLSLTELIQESIKSSSLIIYKERNNGIDNMLSCDWVFGPSPISKYLESLAITTEAIKITHETLSRLVSLRDSSEDVNVVHSINKAFYSIHCVAMKIVHNIHVSLFNHSDIDSTLNRTMHFLSQLSLDSTYEELNFDENDAL